MKTKSLLDVLIPLQKWGLIVKSNGYGSYNASGSGLSILFVVDQRDGLFCFEITRDVRPKHQVDIFAIIDHFHPCLVDQFLSGRYYPSVVDVIRFCVRNLDARVMDVVLNGDDSVWLDLHQKSLRKVKERTPVFYKYVSGTCPGETVA